MSLFLHEHRPRRRDLVWDPFPRDFGFGPSTIEEFMNTASALANAYLPSGIDLDRRHAGRSGMPTIGKDGFEVKLDVSGYMPEELDVKTVDNYIVIKGKHEEKQDEHGFISRQFTRRYALPDNVKPDTVNCSLSSDGFLVLAAPLAIEENKDERPIPIMMSGKPAMVDGPKKESKAMEQ